MDSGFSTSNRKRLQSWLRYYDDLGIRAFYRDRAPRRASTDETVTGIQEKETAEVATAKPAPPAQSRAVPKLPLMGRGPSLFEAAERVEGDSLERICCELAGCTRCKLHRRRTTIVFGVCHSHADRESVGTL